MKRSLADTAFLWVLALVFGVVTLQWVWHVIAPLLPFVLLIGGAVAAYRLLVGRRYF